VLGANDGIVSVAAIIVGVAAADSSRAAILTAGVAGWVAGAVSMAAGEYVSVSSQADSERADLALEQRELHRDPVGERAELAEIYRDRGLSARLAEQVADELSARTDVFAVHAAGASAAAFTVGAGLPLLAVILAPTSLQIPMTVAATVVALGMTGYAGARLGGAPATRGTLRVVIWGVAAMALTMLVGRIVGTAV